MVNEAIEIEEFNYELPPERIAGYPLGERAHSKLLLYRGGELSQALFCDLPTHWPAGALAVFNNTRVVRARLLFHKPTGGRIEIFCLDPATPADYEQAFAVRGQCSWHCIVGNARRWRDGALTMEYASGYATERLTARRMASDASGDVIAFRWSSDHTFGELLELLGRVPIPPYLCRESEELDAVRYQTVYSRCEGSVAAPTAGLHFTPELLEAPPFADRLEVTLHVGAGTFLPVGQADARKHTMHAEFFRVDRQAVGRLASALRSRRPVVAVGTTSVRTLESLAVLGERVLHGADPRLERPVGQWEPYGESRIAGAESLEALHAWLECSGMERVQAATEIMIVPGYRWRVVHGLVTNFHQPKSTLLLLVAALVGRERWGRIYAYALAHDFRFLSYGDSSLLLP